MSRSWAKKRSVMRRYNLTSQIYDARYGEEQEAKYNVALECVQVSRDDSVLDVGCGSGLFFSRVAAVARMVVGVDISKQLLRIAHERSRAFSNVFLVLADADNLPFRETVFSGIFVFTVLQNMPKPTKTLAELSRVSHAGAVFAVTGLKAVVSLESIGSMLESAGFQVRSLRDDEALRCNVAICVRG